jgi:hypothetical protein
VGGQPVQRGTTADRCAEKTKTVVNGLNIRAAKAARQSARHKQEDPLLSCHRAVKAQIESVVEQLTTDERAALSERLRNLVTELLGQPAASTDRLADTRKLAEPASPMQQPKEFPELPARFDRRGEQQLKRLRAD